MRELAVSIGILILAGAGHAVAQPARPSFDELDADRSSTLTQDEVRVVLERVVDTDDVEASPEPGSPSVELVFERWDADGDGSVTREEYDARPRQGRGGPRAPEDEYLVPRRPPLVF